MMSNIRLYRTKDNDFQLIQTKRQLIKYANADIGQLFTF